MKIFIEYSHMVTKTESSYEFLVNHADRSISVNMTIWNLHKIFILCFIPFTG